MPEIHIVRFSPKYRDFVLKKQKREVERNTQGLRTKKLDGFF